MTALFWFFGLASALEPAVPLEERVAVAERVVVAEVLTTESRWSVDRPGDIETAVWLAVEQTHKGEHKDTLEILVEGGQIGAHRTGISTQPTLLEDHRYLLLLVPDFQGRLRVLGTIGAFELPSAAPQLFVLNGNDWSWEPNPVSDGFEINADSFPDPDGTDAAFQMSLTIWNAEGLARIYLPHGGRTDNSTYGGGDDGHNVTMYEPVTWSSALAQSAYNSIGSEMIDCDTEFYGANSFGPKDWSVDPAGATGDAYDFAHTSVHELGHCLGLSHSNDGDAVMQSTNSSGTGWERRHLGDDDRAGLQAMYGAGVAGLQIVDSVVSPVVGAPGGVLSIEVSVTNAGNAPAVDVQGAISASGPLSLVQDAAELGDLPPGASRGTRADRLQFQVAVDEACAADAAEIALSVTDLAGNLVEDTISVDLDCGAVGPGPDGEDPSDADSESAGGCGCDQGAGRGGVAAGLALLLRRRLR